MQRFLMPARRALLGAAPALRALLVAPAPMRATAPARRLATPPKPRPLSALSPSTALPVVPACIHASPLHTVLPLTPPHTVLPLSPPREVPPPHEALSSFQEGVRMPFVVLPPMLSASDKRNPQGPARSRKAPPGSPVGESRLAPMVGTPGKVASMKLTESLRTLFDSAMSPSQATLDAHLSQHLPSMGMRHIAMLLHRARKMSSLLLPMCDIARRVEALPHSDVTAQSVGNALIGLQFCSSDVPEVRTMLAALVPKVASCTELDAQAVGNALYGLQNCSSDVPEVRTLLAALVPKVESCTERLSAQNVGNALYGLQICSSDVPEVNRLLVALTPLIASCADSLTAQHLGMAFSGLQGVDPLTFLSLFRPFILALVKSSFVSAHFDHRGCCVLVKGLVELTHAWQALPPSPNLTRLSAQIDQHLKALAAKLDDLPSGPSGSKSEHRFASFIQRELAGRTDIVVKRNIFLLGIEADVVLQLANSHGGPRRMNLEYDGPHHTQKDYKRWDPVRDAYLVRGGVKVFRYASGRSEGQGSDARLRSWLQNIFGQL